MHKSIYASIGLPLSVIFGPLSPAVARDLDARMSVGAEVVAPCVLSITGISSQSDRSQSVVACAGNQNVSFKSFSVQNSELNVRDIGLAPNAKAMSEPAVISYRVAELSF